MHDCLEFFLTIEYSNFRFPTLRLLIKWSNTALNFTEKLVNQLFFQKFKKRAHLFG